MKTLTLILAICLTLTASAQVGINNTTPDASSMLDITSTSTGVLIPRMTTAQRNLINLPANGLIIYNTDSDEFQFNSNSITAPIWQALDTVPASVSTIGQSVKYVNTDITSDINTNAATAAPLIGALSWNDNTTLYVANTTSNTIEINETGRYKIIVNLPLITAGAADRLSPEMRITVNGSEVGAFSATGYIRTNNGHQESSLHLTEILEITNEQTIGVNVKANANNGGTATTNDVLIRGAGNASIYIEKLM